MTIDEKEQPKEMVVHPQHYNTGKYEVIDVIEDWKLGFNDGCALRYIGRHKHKGVPEEDLKKALWYIARELESKYATPPEALAKIVSTVRK